MMHCFRILFTLYYLQKTRHEKLISYKNNDDVYGMFLLLYVYKCINESEKRGKRELHGHPQAWDLQ